MIRRNSTIGAVLAMLLLCSPAVAGTLYRCVGNPDQPTNYSSTPVAGMTCKPISFSGGAARKGHTPTVFGSGSGSASDQPAAAGQAVASTPLPESPQAGSVVIPAAKGAPAIAGMASSAYPASVASGSSSGKSAAARGLSGNSDPTLPAPGIHGGQPRVTYKTLYRYTDKNGVDHLEDEIHKPSDVHAEVVDTHTQTCYDGVHCEEVGHDLNGSYSYANLIRTCYACGVLPGVNFGRLALNTTAFAAEISLAASTYGVDEGLVRAIIHAESDYNPNAISYKGARGLMQLMPATATRFGVQNAFSAAENINGGVQYLSFLSRRYNGNVQMIAAAYNSGEANVDRYGGIPPFAETQRYVERVSTLAERYRSAK